MEWCAHPPGYPPLYREKKGHHHLCPSAKICHPNGRQQHFIGPPRTRRLFQRVPTSQIAPPPRQEGTYANHRSRTVAVVDASTVPPLWTGGTILPLSRTSLTKCESLCHTRLHPRSQNYYSPRSVVPEQATVRTNSEQMENPANAIIIADKTKKVHPHPQGGGASRGMWGKSEINQKERKSLLFG